MRLNPPWGWNPPPRVGRVVVFRYAMKRLDMRSDMFNQHTRHIFGGSTPPTNLTDVCPSNIWGVYTAKIFDGCMSVKYLGGLHPQNI